MFEWGDLRCRGVRDLPAIQCWGWGFTKNNCEGFGDRTTFTGEGFGERTTLGRGVW
jgi:hypothetical protein